MITTPIPHNFASIVTPKSYRDALSIMIADSCVFVCFQDGNSLPENFLLQMDSCYRENKNKYIMGFMAYLIEENIFKEVITFILKG